MEGFDRGTLLGPEGTGNRTSSGIHVRMDGWHLSVRIRITWISARILRTAQWTRASSFCGQVFKGTWWMPRHQEPMKDVGGCDKPRGAANRAVIRGYPNGETQLG